MPQLDKYIFFNQIIALIVIFFLIYVYIREKGMPIIGGLLYYRMRRLEIYNLVNSYMKRSSFHSHKVWTFFGNNLMPKFNDVFMRATETFETKAKTQLKKLKTKLIKKTKLKKSGIALFVIKLNTEELRLNKLHKSIK